MSGMVMIRRENGIELYSDGGRFRSTSDFTITGFVSKPITLPHIGAVVGYIGTSELGMWLAYDQQPRWRSFDHLVAFIRDGVWRGIETLFASKASRDSITAMLFIGGYSERRERWESYMLVANAKRDQEPEIGELVDDYWCLFAPAPDADGLIRYGFDPEKPSIHSPEDAVSFMRAIRASPQEMDAPFPGADPHRASTIAGFIERVTLVKHAMITEVLWRWPDEPGYLVDPDDEGEPTPAFLALLQAAEAAREDGGIKRHVEGSAPDAGTDHTTDGETGEISDTAKSVQTAAPHSLHGSDAAVAPDVVLTENNLATVDDAGGLVSATGAGEAATGEAEELPDAGEKGAEEPASTASLAEAVKEPIKGHV